MALKDIINSPVTVDAPEYRTSFTVRGITLGEIAQLTRDHTEAVKLMVEGDFNMVKLVEEFPKFVADIIGAGTGEGADVAAQLPAGIQLKALEAIWKQTSLDTDFIVRVATQVIDGAATLNKKMVKNDQTETGRHSSNGNQDLQNSGRKLSYTEWKAEQYKAGQSGNSLASSEHPETSVAAN